MGAAASTLSPATTLTTSKSNICRRLLTHGYSLTWWKHFIFPYLGANAYDCFRLRRFCRLFRDALPAPVWTTFPLPNFSTLDKLVNRINILPYGQWRYCRTPDALSVGLKVLAQNPLNVYHSGDSGNSSSEDEDDDQVYEGSFPPTEGAFDEKAGNGVIQACRLDGTFDILFSDGTETVVAIPWTNIMTFSVPKKGPDIVFVRNGVHSLTESWPSCEFQTSLTLIGQSRENTIVEGGMCVQGQKGDHVRLETLTIRFVDTGIGCYGSTLRSKKSQHANYFAGGASLNCTDLLIDGSAGSTISVGVFVRDAECTLTNCHITNCGRQGIKVGNCFGGVAGQHSRGVAHIYGEKSQVTGNGCGLLTYCAPSKIILHAPLTKESVSYDNNLCPYGKCCGESGCTNRMRHRRKLVCNNWFGPGIIEEAN